MTRTEYTAFLRKILIPDLRADGPSPTADDFETALRFMEEDAARIEELRDGLAELVAIHDMEPTRTRPVMPMDTPLARKAIEDARKLIAP